MHLTPVSNSSAGVADNGEERPLLKVEDLHVHFMTAQGELKAVMGVDFHVGRQETLCLVGESGSGKTVTSLALMRLAPPPAEIKRGKLIFDGRDLMDLSKREMGAVRGRHMAMVFQNPAHSLNPIMTIGDQLGEIYAWHEKAGKRETRERVAELLRLVGITDPENRLSQFPHELSGGMKQRVCIARALLCDPALILADEPTTNLDVTIQAQILDLLDEMKGRYGASMVLVTHDMGVVARMADRIAVMYAGRICETADVRTIFSNPQHPYTRALLESTPRIDQHYERGKDVLPVIGGRPPNLAERPTGCQFHTRCPEAGPECRQLMPQVTEIAPGHGVSCLKRGSHGEPTQ